jgi:ribosome-associated protein
MEDGFLAITNTLSLPVSEIVFEAIRAQGAGGQNVNKVSSAVHLRFDIPASSLPDEYKTRLMSLKDSRITAAGVVIIKAQRFRSQEKNRADGLERLAEIIRQAGFVPKRRKPTKPSKSSQTKRLDEKTRRSRIKTLRRGDD